MKTVDIKKTNKRSGKVLAFEQDSEFYFKRALACLERNNLPDAMLNYRRALRRDMNNGEIRLAIAELLTQMERYEESNRILLLLADKDDFMAESHFGIGCNLIGLNDYDGARESLERYIEMEPEGEFAYDAFDMLDALDEYDFVQLDDFSFQPVAQESPDKALVLAYEAREELEAERYDSAIALCKEALVIDPKHSYARNNLALAYYCKRETKKAIIEAERVLAYDKNNLQTLCNLAIFHHGVGDDTRANMVADSLIGRESKDPEELNRIALVLTDLERFEEAYVYTQKLASQFPYDVGALHRNAVCAYETGRYQRAKNSYDRLLKIDEQDSIARYYRGQCRAAMAGASKRRKFMIHYQVPYDEMLVRISRLNELMSLTQEQLNSQWSEGGEVYSLVEWGFTLPDVNIKRTLLALVAGFGDERAEYLMRDLVLQREQPDLLKRETFLRLAQIGAVPPYIGYIDGRLRENKVTLNAIDAGDVPMQYHDVLMLCAENIHETRNEEIMLEATGIWVEYIESLDKKYPRMSAQQVVAMAAALEYCACKNVGEKAVRTEICAKYGVSAQRFKNAMEKLGIKL